MKTARHPAIAFRLEPQYRDLLGQLASYRTAKGPKKISMADVLRELISFDARRKHLTPKGIGSEKI